MSEATNETNETKDSSVFQKKYDDFVDDLLGALPEYTKEIQAAKVIDSKERLTRFQAEVKISNTMSGGDSEEYKNIPASLLLYFFICDIILLIVSPLEMPSSTII